MYVFLIVLLVLFLVSVIRVRGVVSYGENGFSCFIRILFIKFCFPKEKKKKNKAAELKDVEDKNGNKSYGSLKELTWMLKPVLSEIGKLARMITVKTLYADVKISSDNAASTALLFGGVSAGLGVAIPFLDSRMKIKKKKIIVAPDFLESESVISLRADMYIYVWQMIIIAAYLLYQLLNKKRNLDNKKGLEENG